MSGSGVMGQNSVFFKMYYLKKKVNDEAFS